MAAPGAADAFASRAWGAAYALLSATPAHERGPADLGRLAVACYLLGKDDEATAAWEQAHKSYADEGNRAEAARCAFWAAFSLMIRGQMAHASGWLSLGESVLGPDVECPARGYLLIPPLLHALDADDGGEAERLATRAGEIAARFDDADLAAFATLGHGQALLAQGDTTRGLAKLDQVMLSVSAGEVGPIVSGIVYCAVILECMQLFDLARATEWTAALTAWCESQPDLVPYRGQCLVHQSQLLQAAGDWTAAATTAADACDRLEDPPHPALGLAHYQEGELHRLRGEADAADEAYRRASATGHDPMPGFALLELQRGDLSSAGASIRRALGAAGQPFQRPGLLAAAVEIHLATGDTEAAAEAASELESIAARSTSAALVAMAAHATGAVLLAQAQATDALTKLRAATASWQRLRMPYEAARSAVLVGAACAAVGDHATAAVEFDHARATFESLGARPDLLRIPGPESEASTNDVLSAREVEVLRLVAAGKTNRAVATELSISPHTVRRHLENTFAKLGVNSRAAAIAYAYEHDLF